VVKALSITCRHQTPTTSPRSARLTSPRLKPSPGVPRNVPALVSAATIDASTAHHGMGRPPSAKSCIDSSLRPEVEPEPHDERETSEDDGAVEGPRNRHARRLRQRTDLRKCEPEAITARPCLDLASFQI